MPELTLYEKAAIIELLKSDLAYYHETLAMDYKTVESAMAVFDVTHAVTALGKLAPDELAKIRKSVLEYLERCL